MNTGAPWPGRYSAESRVLEIQTKLHQWATDDPSRRFDDLFNLVCDPAFLVDAWERVRGNRGARTAGVDGQTAFYVTAVRGVEGFLDDLRADLKAQRFQPLPVRERMIPKAGGKLRRLGIPTLRDRVVQAALKSVLEPIFEADFKPCSYGFRPGRRAQDAIAEVHFFSSPARNYEWVLEGDITACFDEIDHTALMDRVRASRGQARPALGEGVPQGRDPQRGRGREGHEHRHASRGDPLAAAGQRRPVGPRRALRRGMGGDGRLQRTPPTPGQGTRHLPPRPLRGRLRGLGERHPGPCRGAAGRDGGGASPDGPASVGGEDEDRPHRRGLRLLGVPHPAGPEARVGEADRVHLSVEAVSRDREGEGAGSHQGGHQQPLATLCFRLAPIVRGWVNYFRHGVSKATFDYLREFTWRRVLCWLRHKHRRASWQWLRRRYLPRWWPTDGKVTLFDPMTVPVTRYRYRADRIPSPWPRATTESAA